MIARGLVRSGAVALSMPQRSSGQEFFKKNSCQFFKDFKSLNFLKSSFL